MVSEPILTGFLESRMEKMTILVDKMTCEIGGPMAALGMNYGGKKQSATFSSRPANLMVGTYG